LRGPQYKRGKRRPDAQGRPDPYPPHVGTGERHGECHCTLAGMRRDEAVRYLFVLIWEDHCVAVAPDFARYALRR